MTNLIITGNGFDLAHKLPTKYENFRLYLQQDCSKDSSYVYIPQSRTAADGGEDYDREEVVRLLLHAISEAEPNGEEWREVEASLGRLEYSEFLDSYDMDEEDEGDFGEARLNEDNARELSGSVIQIPEYFSEWVDTIELEDVEILEDFRDLINPTKDFFLNFNYTPTLQKLYGARKVCHIHGKQGEKLLFGHGNNKDYYDYYMIHHVGSEDYLCQIDKALKKNTSQALQEHSTFFEQLYNSPEPIDKIYSFGFSFSEVDEVYVSKICSSMPTENVTWLFHNYSSEVERNAFREVVLRCGFKGTFGIFYA